MIQLRGCEGGALAPPTCALAAGGEFACSTLFILTEGAIISLRLTGATGAI